jgi:hypothetical protein
MTFASAMDATEKDGAAAVTTVEVLKRRQRKVKRRARADANMVSAAGGG